MRPPLTLASASPRRLALLAQIGIVPDRVCPAELDETPLPDELPRLYALRVARAKAAGVHAVGGLTLGADTVVALGRRILPKAADAAEVSWTAWPSLLSGRRHHVLTAVVRDRAGRAHRAERLVDTTVGIRPPYHGPDHGLRRRAARGRARLAATPSKDFAGAFVRFLGGSYSGVVGLPLFETSQLLRGRGWLVP